MALNVTQGTNAIEIEDTVSGAVDHIPYSQVEQVGYVFMRNRPNVGSWSNNQRKSLATVKIHTASGVIVSIPLASQTTDGTTLNVANQATWVNTEAGAQAACADIVSWL